MSWYTNLFKRSKSEEIVNPCPIPDDKTTLPQALQNYINKNVVKPMNIDAFFAAVNIVSNSIAMIPWLFKDDENNLLPKTNYLWHLFDNSELSRFNIIKNIMQDIILYGNGFLYIERDENGRPQTLHYSPAYQTSIFLNEVTHKTYYYNYLFSEKPDDGTNYLHFFVNTDDGYIGKGIMKYAYNVLDIASIIQASTKDYYSTTGNQFGIISPNGVLPTTGNPQKQIDNLAAKYNEVTKKANKGTIFFPSDLKFTPLNTTAKDSALIDSREYNAVAIGRFVNNVSPVLLGDYRHNVYGTLAEAQKEFVIHSIAPTVTMIQDECNRKLIMPSKLGKQFVDLDENAILAVDQEKQANAINVLTSGGNMTHNEARKVLGLPPMEGGDVLTIPFSKVEDNTIGGNKDKNTSDANEDEKQ